MTDYIKREDAIRMVRLQGKNAQFDGMAQDVAPVRRGEWAETVTDGFLFVSCSACGFKTGRIDYNYCPNCGAKMDEEDTNE